MITHIVVYASQKMGYGRAQGHPWHDLAIGDEAPEVSEFLLEITSPSPSNQFTFLLLGYPSRLPRLT